MWMQVRKSLNLSWIRRHYSLKISDLFKNYGLSQTKKKNMTAEVAPEFNSVKRSDDTR